MDQVRIKKFETATPAKYIENLHNAEEFTRTEFNSESGSSNIIFESQTYYIKSDIVGIVQAFIKTRPIATIAIIHNGETIQLTYIKGTGV